MTKRSEASVTASAEVSNRKDQMSSIEALQCKECRASYPLEARFVCEHCFGPLEVSYDFSGLEAESTKRLSLIHI